MKYNILKEKTFSFSCDILSFYKKFIYYYPEYKFIILQLVRSATSIGANVEEAIGAQSKKDFLSKLSIAYKEARETQYWLKLIKTINTKDKSQEIDILLDQSFQIIKIIGSIQINTKKQLFSSRNSLLS